MVKLKSTNKILYYFIQKEKKKIIGVSIVSLISGILSTINIVVLIPIINFSIGSDTMNFVNNGFINDINSDPFIFFIILFLIISTLSLIAEIVSKMYAQKLTNKIILNNEKDLFNKLINLDYTYYSKNKQGEITYTTTIAPQSLAWIIQAVIDILQSGIIIFLYLFLLLSLNIIGTIAVILIGGLYTIFVSKRFNKIISKSSNTRTVLKQHKNVLVNEFLTGIKAIKMNNVESFWEKKYVNTLIDELENYYKMIIFQRIPESLINFLGFFIIGILALVLYVYNNGDISSFIGTFSTFGMTLYKLLPMLKRINGSKLTLTQYLPDVEKLYELLNIELDHMENEGKELREIKKGIAFNNLTFKYNNSSKDVLKHINIEINKNEITALVGPSGSGKSTIVNLIMKLFKAPQNSILIDNTDINEYSMKSIIDKISYVTQDVFLINDTVENNIKFGMENISRENIVEAAKIADAHDFILNLENGYETYVGDLGSKLSGGQKQKIAIARAILRNKNIIILDEATSALDNISERNIQNSLKKLSEKATLIIIAHRLSTVENANKIIVMDSGEVKEFGNHYELMNKKGIYYELYINQKKEKRSK